MRRIATSSFLVALLFQSACEGDGSPLPPGFQPAEPLDAGIDRPPPQRLGEVVTPLHRAPPISGGTLAVQGDGSLAVVADPDRDLVYIVKLSDRSVTTVAMPTGSEPSRIALDGHDRAHVVLRGTGELVRLDLAQKEKVGSTRVCDLPRGVAHDASSDSVIVACSSGDVVWLSADDHAELQRRFVEYDLRDVVPTKHALYVSRYRSAELLRLDAEGKVVERLSPPALNTVRFPGTPLPLAPSDEDGAGASQGFSGLASVTMTPALAWRSLAGPGDTVLTLHQRSQVEQVSVQAGGYGGGCETITQAAATLTGADGIGEPATSLIDSTVAVDVALSPDGRWLAMAAPGNYLQGFGTVTIYDALNSLGGHGHHGRRDHHHDDDDDDDNDEDSDAGMAVPDASVQLPEADASVPDPIIDDPGCGVANATEVADFQATAVAYDDAGLLYAFSREPAALLVMKVDENRDEFSDFSFITSVDTSVISLNERSVEDTGHDLFHANVGSGLACASCHGEALDDGHVWRFEGFGPRRTQNMRGGLSTTAPFHWDGDLPTFQHLVDNVMTGRMGGFQVEPKYADALATWIDAQPAVSLPTRDASSVARGEALFVSSEVGCAACHNGPTLTNNLNMDVGTGGSFQVPSLRGVGLRAPFMHDGCAKTLLERFDPSCGGSEHGRVSQLTQREQLDLVAYLESL